MNIRTTQLPGVVVIEPKVHQDIRGSFVESFHKSRYASYLSGEEPFAQINCVRSRLGVLRGLHLQRPSGQGKLVQATHGRIFDVAVDVDPDSTTFRTHVSVVLDANLGNQVFIPPQYAHGYQAISGETSVVYLCSDFYDPSSEHCIRWDDADLAIEWPIGKPVLSSKDAAAKSLAEYLSDGKS